MRILPGLLVAAASAWGQARMPDGTEFAFWSDQTRYAKTYHVSQDHPRASDRNPGTREMPFLTIGRATQVVQPGERVWIHSGVYREMVEVPRGGEGPDRMIAYEAAPGEVAAIRGSRLLPGPWQRSRDPHGKGLFSRELWMTSLPEWPAFRTPNASDEELDLMPWALEWKGRVPYTLRRGLLFEQGRRMAQLAAYEDLVKVPGSYWVAADGRTVHIRPFGGGDPNRTVFEAAVEPQLFKARTVGLGYVRVSGLAFEHCANGFPRVGVGAVFTTGGHHWIIEGNTVRGVNSVGIEAGFLAWENADKRHARRTDPNLGHVIVRNNHIEDCGTAGIRSHTVEFGLVENNRIRDCGWQDAEYHWETGGIKLLVTHGTLVRGNYISGIRGGGGIWLDWGNRGSRVTGNLIHDARTAQGAVFIEASQEVNWVDHNIIWDIDGQGVRLADTDNAVVAHNLFARVAESLVVARVATDRSLGGRKLTSRDNRVVNNIVADQGKPIDFGDEGNVADFNVYVSTRGATGGRPLETERHSVSMRGALRFDLVEMLMEWRPERGLEAVPAVAGMEGGVPGPYAALARAATVRLK